MLEEKLKKLAVYLAFLTPVASFGYFSLKNTFEFDLYNQRNEIRELEPIYDANLDINTETFKDIKPPKIINCPIFYDGKKIKCWPKADEEHVRFFYSINDGQFFDVPNNDDINPMLEKQIIRIMPIDRAGNVGFTNTYVVPGDR